MIRILSGFLLAVCLTVAVFAGFYYASLRYAETRLAEALAQRLGGTITYGTPQWMPRFDGIQFRLPNVLVRAPLTSGGLVVAELPDLILSSGFFQEKSRLLVLFPQTWVLRLVPKTGNTSVYQIQQDGGQLSLHTTKEGAEESVAQARTLRVTSMQGGRSYSAQNVMVGYTQGFPAATLQFGAQNMVGTGADEVTASFSYTQLPALLATVQNAAQGLTPHPLDALTDTFVQTMQQGSRLQVERFVLTRGTGSVSGWGDIALDAKGRLRGSLSVMAQNASQLHALLDASHLLGLPGFEETFRRQQLWHDLETDRPLLNLTLHQGIAIINTQNVGVTLPLKDMADQWN